MFWAELEGERAVLSRALDIVAEGCRDGVQMGIDEAMSEARARHPYQDHTHNLTRSLSGHVTSFDRMGAEGVLEARAPYASFVEEGTIAHLIRPKEGHGFTGPLLEGQSRRKKTDVGTHRKALRWRDSSGLHFAAVVHHPGGKSFPFMGPALQKFERVVEREIEKACVRAQAELDR